MCSENFFLGDDMGDVAEDAEVLFVDDLWGLAAIAVEEEVWRGVLDAAQQGRCWCALFARKEDGCEGLVFDVGLDADEALRLSDEAIAINPERYLFSATCTKGYVYLAMGKPDSAMQCYRTAMEAYKKEVTWMKEDHPTAHNALSTLYATASYALSPKDIRAKEFIYNDSINSASYRQRLINSEHVQNQQVLLEKQYTLSLHQQQLKLLLTGILCAVILAGGILYLYIRNRRQRWVASEEKAEALEHLLNEARKNTAEEPAADGAFFRRILLKQLGLIRLLASSPTSANQELLRQIANPGEGTEKGNRLLIWEELYPIIDASYNGFYTKLTKRYGELLNERPRSLRFGPGTGGDLGKHGVRQRYGPGVHCLWSGEVLHPGAPAKGRCKDHGFDPGGILACRDPGGVGHPPGL